MQALGDIVLGFAMFAMAVCCAVFIGLTLDRPPRGRGNDTEGTS
jgi:hypothetical protein